MIRKRCNVEVMFFSLISDLLMFNRFVSGCVWMKMLAFECTSVHVSSFPDDNEAQIHLFTDVLNWFCCPVLVLSSFVCLRFCASGDFERSLTLRALLCRFSRPVCSNILASLHCPLIWCTLAWSNSQVCCSFVILCHFLVSFFVYCWQYFDSRVYCWCCFSYIDQNLICARNIEAFRFPELLWPPISRYFSCFWSQSASYVCV